jgi:mono/diheme cytochrome c family protein
LNFGWHLTTNDTKNTKKPNRRPTTTENQARPAAKKVRESAKYTERKPFFTNIVSLMKKYYLLMAILAVGGSVALAADGAALWDQHCASCHGKDGKGQTKMGQKAGVKDYSDAKVQAGVDDAKAFKSTKEGLIEDGKTKMKPFAEKLSDEEIKATIAHLRTLKK